MVRKTESFMMEGFDTLSAVKGLIGVGVKEKHAEEFVRQMQRSRGADISKLANKQDLQMLQLELTKKIDDDHAILQKNIDKLESKLVEKITDSTNSNLKWMLGLHITTIAALITVALKFFG